MLVENGASTTSRGIATLRGWLGYIDAAILDWTRSNDLLRDQLRDLILAPFFTALTAAQHVDPKLMRAATIADRILLLASGASSPGSIIPARP